MSEADINMSPPTEVLQTPTESPVTAPEPVYNHGGVACMAVPTWKAFFFGGNCGSYDQQTDTRKNSSQVGGPV